MLIQTNKLDAAKLRTLGEPTTQQLYCGLDCCMTLEVFEQLSALLTPESASEPVWPVCYTFERALQAPALDMMLRGFKIDQFERHRGIERAKAESQIIRSQLDELAECVWGRVLNPSSPKQLKEFFYGAMRLPEVWTSKHGEKKLSLDRESLEKLEQYFHARPIIALILEARDLTKRLSVLETEIGHDGRMRTSYNIGGTNTGRWSSSSDVTGTGTNLQNITAELRRMFVADRGWKLCGIDLEQAESREVGWLCGTLFQDWKYLDACEGGDLHTTTAKLVWKDLNWTQDEKKDREIAEHIFYRGFSYRDMSKRGGHGCITADHEVLTRCGWVPVWRVNPDDEIMVWSKNGSFFQKPSNWLVHGWTGELVAIQGTSLEAELTADHRVLYYTDKRSPIKETAAEQMPKRGLIPLGSNYVGGSENISPDMARLVAAYQCDGYMQRDDTLRFHLYKERKISRVFVLAKKLDRPCWLTGDNVSVKVKMYWPKSAGAYLLDWPAESLKAYVEEHKFWDGHISATAQYVCSVNREHLEWLQTIGRLVGVGGNLQKPKTSGFGSVVHVLQQNNRQFADIVSLRTAKRMVYNETVYCPTVSTGAFYIRRNNRISVTGNTNYYGTPWTMARHLKVPTALMENFQRDYFTAFPAIPRWHQWVAEQLQRTGKLTTPFGRERTFFGRRDDDTTLRKAIAFSPQSSTGDRLNLGLLRIWRDMSDVQLLAQVHDAVYFQYPDSGDPEREAHYVRSALRLVETTLRLGGREFTVPGEAKVGWNWASSDPKCKLFADGNPEGLSKWNASVADKRVRTPDLERRL